nr:hypothetical protein [Burkholderia pseudomallei]
MHDTSIGDFSPFRREWVIRGRNFGDGQVEVTATRFDRYMGALSLNAMPKAKRGESENSESNLLDAAKRAKQQVRLRCKAIGADRMITLTYRENMQDKARLKRDFDALRRRLAKLSTFQYVATPARLAPYLRFVAQAVGVCVMRGRGRSGLVGHSFRAIGVASIHRCRNAADRMR